MTYQDKEERFYHIEALSKDLPSVTTILGILDKSGPLMGWAVKQTIGYLALKLDDIITGKLKLTEDNAMQFLQEAKHYHKDLKEQAAELGSEAHNLLEVFLKGQNIIGLLEGNPKLKLPFRAFLEWQKQYNFELIKSEHIVWSELGYAGTLDCVTKLNGKVYIIDFKTSKAIYNEYLMQVVAYKSAYEEITDSQVDGIGILRLDKLTGIPEWREIPLMDCFDLMDAFMALCHYFHIKQRNKDKWKTLVGIVQKIANGQAKQS